MYLFFFSKCLRIIWLFHIILKIGLNFEVFVNFFKKIN
jgi:hypothetical protein